MPSSRSSSKIKLFCNRTLSAIKQWFKRFCEALVEEIILNSGFLIWFGKRKFWTLIITAVYLQY